VDVVTPDFVGTRTKLVRTTMLLGLVGAVVVGVLVGVLLSWLIGAVVLLVVGGAWVGFVSLRVKASLDRVLHVTGARRVDAGSEPRWENTVDGLSMSNGIVDAELWIIESDRANAFAAASADRTAFVTTTGLLGALGVVELEAVTANLVGRVKDGSARYGTVAVGVYGAMLGGGRAAQKLAASLGDQRAIATDLAAVDLTRYPPGLAAAFTAIESVGSEVSGVDPVTAHLWLAPVVGADGGVAQPLADTAMQPLALRIAVLDEL